MTDTAEWLSRFQRAVEQRQTGEAALAAGREADPVEQQLQATLAAARETDRQEREAAQAELDARQQQIHSEFELLTDEAEQRHRQTLREIERNADQAAAEVERQRDDSTWVVSSVLDETATDSPVREFERFRTLLHKAREEQVAEWTELEAAIQSRAASRGREVTAPQGVGESWPDRAAAAERFSQALGDARDSLQQYDRLWLPRLFRGPVPFILVAILAGLFGTPFYLFVDPHIAGMTGARQQTAWIAVSAVAGSLAAILFALVLYVLGSLRQSEILGHILDLREVISGAHQRWLKMARDDLTRQQQEAEAQQKQIEHNRRRSLARYQHAHSQRQQEIETEKATALAAENARYTAQSKELTQHRDEQLMQAQVDFDARWQALEQNATATLQAAEEELETYSRQRRRTQQEQWVQLKTQWEQGWQEFDQALRAWQMASETKFRPWEELSKGEWTPPAQIPHSIRLGEYHLDLHKWPGAISEDARLAPRVTEYHVPATLPFPHDISVLIETPNAAARQQAIPALQSMMLRLLTLIPPGKLRFVILDPVGLGESFGGFMHLADYDELLVTSRIWTETAQMEARLADLTAHMENVLQKYLRNEFATIEDYNASAGEVAEPYYFLIVNDFPAKFSDIAARRLTSIVNSGPRCGVYTLMSVDPSKQLPNNFDIHDIEPSMTSLLWRDGHFSVKDAALSAWPLHLDTPPPPAEFTSIVKMVGAASKDIRRVEVSFGRVAPRGGSIWTEDSRNEISVPLGRAGATKLQYLRLGKGTSQHMLIAGKTGSGKSTFLHVLITNLALHYSPEEIAFFLIDFKKGVEFKDYATHALPHAQVIAVESDREFGLSALQKLDEILQERGELFRKQGVQDIAGYRNQTGQTLPRILLIVDEFQEFFIEDDRISQSASLLLDRLVRQGRAFGLHVVLGSQTLGGAYSLARSTLGQVAVRVALQCSEADAHLILSEDNSAARLLTRPGEAIYNDANGMLEGNHPFQIAWITDQERQQAMEQIRQQTRRRGLAVEPAVVFEGNIPSDLSRNAGLARVIDEYSTRERPLPVPRVWLGDAVEIAPPTVLTFARQSGSHLLLVGQDSEAAQGILIAALTSLAASLSPRQEQNSLFVLDGSPAGSPEAETWQRVVATFPHEPQIIGPDEAGQLLQAISAELDRREEAGERDAPPIFLLIHHIARFRDLRKAEDEFSLGGFGREEADKPPRPGKQFADLLARGPQLGIHALIWCDSFSNLDRWFSRQSLRELEMRIAFQMNASDSSNFIDSPAASRLGVHRALLYREETGQAEKFRPYGVPTAEWLHEVRRRLLNGPDSDIVTDLEEFSIL